MDYQLLTAFAAGSLFGYFVASMIQDHMYKNKVIELNKSKISEAELTAGLLSKTSENKKLKERLDVYES